MGLNLFRAGDDQNFSTLEAVEARAGRYAIPPARDLVVFPPVPGLYSQVIAAEVFPSVFLGQARVRAAADTCGPHS